jgi:hypothetical protein
MPCFLPHELADASLVDRILQIQTYRAKETDTASWIENLECLSLKGRSKPWLELAKLDSDGPGYRKFVAVSYRTEPEDLSEGTVPVGMEKRRRSGRGTLVNHVQTREIVLSRVLKYAGNVGVDYFWIDKECIVQNNKTKLKNAMAAMHLVYGRSSFPVALLELTLSKAEVGLLHLLMVEPKPEPDRLVNSGVQQRMIAMLKHIREDPWWGRTWTFQEEYMAGQRMRLLMRHGPGVKKSGMTELGKIEGEACISATNFRKQATIFLLNVRKSKETCEELKIRCSPLLKTFAKYNVLYQERDLAESRAMSTSIFAATEERNLDENWGYDYLPITANVCDYDRRLSSDQLAKSSHSIGLCALTMWLMNGEIFKNDENTTKPAKDVGLSEYLETISFDRFRPPSQVFQLSWLKECRLRPTGFSDQGIVTFGILWHVHTKIETSNWDRGQYEWCHSEEFGLNAYQRKRLTQLLHKVQLLANGDKLSSQLDQYLEKDEGLKKSPKKVKEYMDLMAEEVVEAIRCGKSLYLATLEGPCEGSAIFVEGTGDEAADPGTMVDMSDHSNRLVSAAVDFTAFTSWSKSHHISMTVKLAEPASESKSPLMTITGWTNGLAFYDGVRQRKDLVVRWPETWQRKPLKRRRSSESPRFEGM